MLTMRWDLLPTADDALPGRAELLLSRAGGAAAAVAEPAASPSPLGTGDGYSGSDSSALLERPRSAPTPAGRERLPPLSPAGEEMDLVDIAAYKLRNPYAQSKPQKGLGWRHQVFLRGQWQAMAGRGAPWTVAPGPGIRRLGDRCVTPSRERGARAVTPKPSEQPRGRFRPAPGTLPRSGQLPPTPQPERPLSRLAFSPGR
eukprot:TRINITY_DN14373_c0_g1_i1.p1 TRINITY_DN14373_c0_g1~~TRINITY_DN14373_c0_g1_i1.p1  ORF type:complete len:228 (+),score=38.12 TRINITY_DN14373_c0_g1_i1:83-685(+)